MAPFEKFSKLVSKLETMKVNACEKKVTIRSIEGNSATVRKGFFFLSRKEQRLGAQLVVLHGTVCGS